MPYNAGIVEVSERIYNYDDRSAERTQDKTYLPDNFAET